MGTEDWGLGTGGAAPKKVGGQGGEKGEAGGAEAGPGGKEGPEGDRSTGQANKSHGWSKEAAGQRVDSRQPQQAEKGRGHAQCEHVLAQRRQPEGQPIVIEPLPSLPRLVKRAPVAAQHLLGDLRFDERVHLQAGRYIQRSPPAEIGGQKEQHDHSRQFKTTPSSHLGWPHSSIGNGPISIHSPSGTPSAPSAGTFSMTG